MESVNLLHCVLCILHGGSVIARSSLPASSPLMYVGILFTLKLAYLDTPNLVTIQSTYSALQL